MLRWLRQHRTKVTLVRVTFNCFLANSAGHRGHLGIKSCCSATIPAPHLSAGTWLRCSERAWLRVQSPAHRCMWSLHLTSQVGTGTRWCWAGIQCSFHSMCILLERNKNCLYGCPKIPLESTSSYSSYGNPCEFVCTWHHGTFNSSLLKLIHIFALATLTEWQHSALCWDSSYQNQSECNHTAWKSQGPAKWRLFW